MTRPRAIHLALATVAVAGIAFSVLDSVLAGRPAFPLDDAWIHLKFALRLAAGDGLAYGGEEWVTGSTAPLWSALLSVGFLLPAGFPLFFSELLAILALGSAVWGIHQLTAELAPGRDLGLAGAAALLTATTPWLLWSAASGMEITTFTSLAVWGMVWHVRELRRPHLAARSTVLLAAATLARPEGALLLSLSLVERGLHRAREDRAGALRDLAAAGGAATVVLLPTLLFYRVAGGSVLPTTFWVKAGGPADLWPDARYLRLVVDFFVRSQPAATLLAAAGALLLLVRLRGPLDRGLLPAAWLAGQAVAYSLIARPGTPVPMGNFGRYWFPLLPVVLVLGLLALVPAARRLRRAERFGISAWTLCLLVFFCAQIPGLVRLPAAYARHVSDVESTDVRAAKWLAPRLDPRALVAVQDVGALGFFLPNRTLDLAGLTSPEILPVLRQGGSRGGGWQGRLHDYLRRSGTDYLVVFASSYPQLVRSPGFRVVQVFQNPYNRTMAGEDLMILETPWSRFPLSEIDAPPEPPPG